MDETSLFFSLFSPPLSPCLSSFLFIMEQNRLCERHHRIDITYILFIIWNNTMECISFFQFSKILFLHWHLEKLEKLISERTNVHLQAIHLNSIKIQSFFYIYLFFSFTKKKRIIISFRSSRIFLSESKEARLWSVFNFPRRLITPLIYY